MAMLLVSLASTASGAGAAAPQPESNGYVGNEACASCHASIYESYRRSAMAHASGPASEDVLTGEFIQPSSGVKYRIYLEAGKLWLSFERPDDPMVRGKREFLYYVGQGRRGRTYLFAMDGFLFESPVNWYGDKHVWDMTPAYSNAREIPLNLPVLVSCLDCHVSGVRPPIAGTENRYTKPVFGFAGVTCERCHGPGAAHVKGGAIVNPAKIKAEARDQVCMQCHLEGNAAIERAGKHLYEYRPGDNLFDYLRYYTLSGGSTGTMRAASQFEALAQSTCKKKSGDAMTCTSCHDPHRTVSAAERVSFYRAKCLVCHGAALGTKHHPQQPDCTSCHMPAAASSDVAHTEVTDHRILRRPDAGSKLQAAGAETNTLPELKPFPYSKEAAEDERGMALAWQSVVNSGMTMAQPRAEKLLREALAKSSDDPALLAALAYAEQKDGADARARELYRKALANDPSLIDAATNLGVLEARSGETAEAVKLWQSAFQRAPGRSEIGINLARAFCAAGQYEEARNYTLRVLQFNPDLGTAKRMLKGLNASPARCGE